MPPSSNVSNDANTFMPLLFAAHPELVPNYRRMAAMDDQARTASALEHKFRNWRQEGKKILGLKGDNVEAAKASLKKSSGPARKTTSLRGGGDTEKGSRLKADKDGDKDNGEDGRLYAAETSQKAQMNTSKKTTAVRGKKRAMSTGPNSDDVASPTKKPKRGTAQVVKKPKAKPREELVSDSDDDDDDDDDEEEDNEDTLSKASGKGKGKPCRRSKATLRPMDPKVAEKINKASREENTGLEKIEEEENEDSVEDEEGGGEKEEIEEETTEMKFEEE